MSRRRRILVVTPTPWELAAIKSPQLQERYEFILCGEDLAADPTWWKALRFDVVRYLKGVARQYGHPIDGVMGTGDYPGCLFSAWLARELHLPGPHPEVVLRMSHKLISREIQAKTVPEATPLFEVIKQPGRRPPRGFTYPFFVKPVKGAMSIRASMVRDNDELRRAVSLSWREMLRAWVLLRPFQQLLTLYGDTRTSVWDFIAEAPLYGVQVTVDGFVQRGEVTIMGIVDSVMYPGTMSFQRFEYPSTLPGGVLARMADITTRFVEGSGLDQTCFNVELFYDAERDLISIIEINPRMSYQFSDLYQQVDGTSTFEIQLALITGQEVVWVPGAGPDKAAASFVERRFKDGRVVRTPSPSQLAEVESMFPGTHVEALCEPGEHLSDHDQDVGSFRYCITNLSAPSREVLFQRYDRVKEHLPFVFEDT